MAMYKNGDETDFHIEDHGTVVLLRPVTEEAEAWIVEHISHETARFGNAVVVEHRYIVDIVRGIIKDGLTFTGI